MAFSVLAQARRDETNHA